MARNHQRARVGQLGVPRVQTVAVIAAFPVSDNLAVHPAFHRQAADALVVGIGNIQPALLVYGQAGGIAKSAVRAFAVPLAGKTALARASDGKNQMAARLHPADPVVARIGNKQISPLIKYNGGRTV